MEKNKDFKNISLYFWLFYRYRCHYPIFRENVFYVTFMSISTLKKKQKKNLDIFAWFYKELQIIG